jgi:hypothetical protein
MFLNEITSGVTDATNSDNDLTSRLVKITPHIPDSYMNKGKIIAEAIRETGWQDHVLNNNGELVPNPRNILMVKEF